MPSTTLTRKELYELIWSKPMTQTGALLDHVAITTDY